MLDLSDIRHSLCEMDNQIEAVSFLLEATSTNPNFETPQGFWWASLNCLNSLKEERDRLEAFILDLKD